eukprot:CAMPEP_0206032668 /NCGR_PEP_ID=MMETSP1466-20131121/98_1 /ASSEMBLY_ACC=CAM_ASM_001126 /TAXON_ID=44452 /ORGANISM="Pavlova gyrans, Strain CCMP608" /LENGTH=89 /DNA_ID=CAMNT_0053406803 /DNA_START=142 /DNA_END=408 /DNA_ORIENTATION=-
MWQEQQALIRETKLPRSGNQPQSLVQRLATATRADSHRCAPCPALTHPMPAEGQLCARLGARARRDAAPGATMRLVEGHGGAEEGVDDV